LQGQPLGHGRFGHDMCSGRRQACAESAGTTRRQIESAQ
jgi:hypothetical protein